MLEAANAQVKYYEILPDEKELIQQKIRQWVAEDMHFIFTTGVRDWARVIIPFLL